MQKHIRKQKCIRRGTMSKEIRTLGLTCPGVNLPQLTTISELTSNGNGKNKQIKTKLAQDLTFDDLKLIRKQASLLLFEYLQKRLPEVSFLANLKASLECYFVLFCGN